ncbi:Bestrophin, RFP-TM, chloride channel-domain-containing protein [Coniochaeta sp. 2T2.1]|nr:Bestrophin, RFP-TM, chloride channel-domain-containing protein [Coniochaeta sp. 2T2.1]
MAEDGGHATVHATADTAAPTSHGHTAQPTVLPPLTQQESPMSPRIHTPNPFSRHNTSLDLDDYFKGPRDIQRHSKWPLFLRMHGSILPKMILPLLCVAAWTTAIVVIHKFRTPLAVNTVLLTVTGFVVGLGLSFRSSTAYERYAEGRRYWAQLILASQQLGRVFWIHAKERDGELAQKDLLAKVTVLNLLVAFAVSLKHKLRYEPYAGYDDLASLVNHLDTFAGTATREQPEKATGRRKPGFLKATGEYLGVSFAASNPRKTIKQAQLPLGNLPLEILSYIASFTDELVQNGQLTVPMQQTIAYNNIASLNDVLTGTERVLTTPLPIAYTIAISQITWVYVFLLPFQLLSVPFMNWVTIPAAVAAAYIILGILFIGREIENPFGEDVNDLPLESYCAQIASELDILASKPKPQSRDWIETVNNRVLWPLSGNGWQAWMNRGPERVREALKAKTEIGFEARKQMAAAEIDAEKRGNGADVGVSQV